MKTPTDANLSDADSSKQNATPRHDPLLESLIIVAEKEGIECSRTSLTSGLPLVEDKLSPELFVRAAERVSLKATVVERQLSEISNLVMPVVVLLEGNNAAVLLASYDEGKKLRVALPLSGEERLISSEEFALQYQGYCIYTTPSATFESRLEQDNYRDKTHWFWGVLGRSWKIYRDVLLASFLINIFVIANPLFVMNVYDRVVPNNAVETLWALAIGIIVLFCFDFVLRLLRTYFIEVAGKKADILLSSLIFEKVLGADYSLHPKSVGAFANQVREFESVRNFITSATVTTFVDLPFVLMFLVVVTYIGGPIVWVPIVAIPLILLYAWVVQRQLKVLVAQTFSASAQKNATLVEALSNLETLKILGSESKILRRWETSVGQLALWGLKSRVMSSSATSFSAFVQQLASVFVVIVGVYSIAQNELTQGALIGSVILVSRCLAPLAQVSALLVQYHQSKLALDSLEEIVKRPQERPADRKFVERLSFDGGLELKEVNFTYPGETAPSLKDISIKVSPGERVAIIGRIGSGKSTLNKLLMGLYRPSSGAVLVDNIDITQIDPAQLRSHIGYVPQDSALFYGSIRENIAFRHGIIADEEIIRVADIAGVSEFVNAHPMGFEREVSERGESLSGGQRQTINIARGLLNSPPIYLFDEPTTMMDNASEAKLLSNLKQETEGKTLVLVTHKTNLLTLVDRVVVLDGGKVIADGPKDTVLEALKRGQLRVS